MLANITITHVPNDANVIAKTFENLGLFKTKKICVFPEFNGKSRFYRAYVEIGEWYDRETAYNLIKRIRNPRLEARVIHNDDNWWAIEETEKEDLKYTQNEAFNQWTISYTYEQVIKNLYALWEQTETPSNELEGTLKQIETEHAFQQVAMMV